MTHECIKPTCKARYEDDETDAYYCVSCRENNKVLAKELNQKFVTSPRAKSDLEIYNEAPRIHGFPSAKNFMV